MKPTHKAQVYQYSQDFFAVKTADAADFANEFNLDLLDVDNVYWLNFHNLDDRIHSQMQSDLLREIELQKRQLINLRKIVQPIKDLLAVLESMDNALIALSNKHYYKNLRNSCVSLLEDIDAHKQILEGLSNLYYAVQGQRMNHIMKVLTVVSSIFIPLTFIVGVYGMNFKHMPELDYPYGYYTVVGVMFVLSFSLLLFFIKRGWLKRD